MRVSFEALLMLLVLALYLFDSSMFLGSHEAVLSRARGHRWSGAFGLDRWRLGGREPYLPNPFTPHRPMFRLQWRIGSARRLGVDAASAVDSTASARPVVVPDALPSFAPHVWVNALCLFVLLPAALFVPFDRAILAGSLVLLYAGNMVALVRLYRRRDAFRLTRSNFAALAFECLACPPFSVNLIRKLCTYLRVDEDFVQAAERVLDADALGDAKRQCLRRVDEEIEGEPEGTARMRSLLAGRARFVDTREGIAE